jgi:predicted TPR repeat methyltransferase
MREKKGNMLTAYEMAYDERDEVSKHYADWAKSYDADTADYGYVGPASAVQELAKHLEDRQASVLDIGCGTGLVGVALAEMGFSCIDGTDLSEEMIEVCRGKQCYRHLQRDDLLVGIDLPEGSHDAVICVGTFGPLGTDVLPNALRQVRPGGIACISVNEIFLAKQDFAAAFDALCKTEEWHLVSQGMFPHLTEGGHEALITVLGRT